MLDLDWIRAQFPALACLDDGQPRLYLDNPAGTQVPEQVLNRMRDYLVHHNANSHGAFRTSIASDALLADAHQAMADLLNAPSPHEIIFGPNMTSLTFSLSRALASWLKPGQEIILTRLDHDANIAPWLRIAEERGAIVKWLDFDPSEGTLRLEELESLLSDRTFLVAFGYASNLLGTVNPVERIVQMAQAHGALTFVDAVHYLPHGPVDVQKLKADFLVCSPYKFFGPHQGVLWGRAHWLERLPAYRVRPAGEALPGKFETGTQSHESQAGTLGALEYLSALGEKFGAKFRKQFPGTNQRQLQLHCAMRAIQDYEQTLSQRLLQGLTTSPRVRVLGIKDESRLTDRVPTVSFTIDGISPQEIARRLAQDNIFVWDGHSYALEVVKRLGLEDQGGVVRVGPVHYNTVEELDRLLERIRAIK